MRSSRAACQVSRITYCVLRTSDDQRPTTNDQRPTTNEQRTARRIAYRPSAARGSRAFRL
ncbi:hypothetical protein EGT65_03835 [Burkholderia mallei]|uniref:Uncharacterized protein n=1 Tax=Burkholderia mallei TaxID=13373 RepID=A0AAX1XAR5_BURML|nr:hypothetical protein EGT70_01780 [Burkholderia mallei]RPA47264.1 hypothetical protein EGT65_03835 [Burkholderia mallei]